MAQKQILSLKPASTLKCVDNKHSERVKKRKHQSKDALIPSSDANPNRMGFPQGTANTLLSCLRFVSLPILCVNESLHYLKITFT